MNWWEYLILVNVYLVLFFGFYALLLKKETFFQLNRLYLVSAALLSFLVPLIQSNWIKNLFITQTVHATIYGSPVIAYQFKPVADTPVTIGELLAVTYLVGVGLLLIRFALQLISLKRIISRPDANAPYTFFKKVKVDSTLSENEIIAAHEQVHANQLHSADVMIIEAVMIVNWFNPVVYFYRFAIKHIHEFIADSYTLRNGTDKTDYAMLLLSQTFNAPQHQLVSNFFNRGLLKQRIIMLQKNRSARIKLVKYGLSAPLFALMLILSAATVNTSKAVTRVNILAGKVLAMPANKITAIRLVSTPDSGKTDTVFLSKKIALPIAGIDPAIKSRITSMRVYAVQKSAEQATDTIPNQIFTAVEKEPTFPGDFGAFLGRNIRYPAVDKDNNIQGKVFIQFIVEADGSLDDFKVLRAPSETLGDEAVRVLSTSPKWRPGIQNGRTVRVMYTVPISFSLSPPDDRKTKTLPGAEIVGYDKADTTKQGLRIQSWDSAKNPAAEALIIIDGKEKTYEDLKAMDVNTINSISVLKDKSAQKLYGDKGKNGVIIVSTKK
ncbi:MAG: TonB family protein [Mucilaginibacter sp.]